MGATCSPSCCSRRPREGTLYQLASYFSTSLTLRWKIPVRRKRSKQIERLQIFATTTGSASFWIIVSRVRHSVEENSAGGFQMAVSLGDAVTEVEPVEV